MCYLILYYDTHYSSVSAVYGPITSEERNKIIEETETVIWVSVPVEAGKI